MPLWLAIDHLYLHTWSRRHDDWGLFVYCFPDAYANIIGKVEGDYITVVSILGLTTGRCDDTKYAAKSWNLNADGDVACEYQYELTTCEKMAMSRTGKAMKVSCVIPAYGLF